MKDDWRKKLAKVSDDDQTATILRWLNQAKWPGSGYAPAWTEMFARLVELGDPGAVEPLRALAKDLPAFLGAKHRLWIAERMAATADAISKKTKGEKAAPIVLPKSGASGDTMSIIQRVFDAPDDDDVRRVVADQLLEHGDPWGEFIQLGFLAAEKTITPAQTRLAETLQRKHAATFGGPLMKIAKMDGRGFEKGFLSRLHSNATMVARPAWEAAAKSPYWATVKRLEVGCIATPRWWLPELLKNPAVKGLREVHFNRYQQPQISLVRASVTAPWRVTAIVTTGERWMKYFRDFVAALGPAEQKRLEVAAVPMRNELLQSLADHR